MWYTCIYVFCMAKMIQLRNVPDELHRLLKARAALEGLSLSQYLLAEIRRSAERPTLHELHARLHQRTPVVPDVSPAEVIRALRDQP
jgi:plasmid stability protein